MKCGGLMGLFSWVVDRRIFTDKENDTLNTHFWTNGS